MARKKKLPPEVVIDIPALKRKQRFGGGQFKFNSVRALQRRINRYFRECDEERRPYTIVGLANSLDIDRHFLLRYGARDRFSAVIKRAKQRCTQFSAEHLYTSPHVAGAIFDMKNNHDHTDKTEASIALDANVVVDVEDEET